MEQNIEKNKKIKEIEESIYDWLLLLGLSPSYLGTKYICKSMLILLLKKKDLECMELYKQVGSMYNKSGSSVERAIRYCKEQYWKRIYKKYHLYINEENENNPLPNEETLLLLTYLFKKEKGDKIEKI